jgi:hypothetical protein
VHRVREGPFDDWQFDKLKEVHTSVMQADKDWLDANPVPSKETGHGGEMNGETYDKVCSQHESLREEVPNVAHTGHLMCRHTKSTFARHSA